MVMVVWESIMKKFKLIALIGTFALSIGTAHAGAYEHTNVKKHCVIIKNGKVVKQQTCTADGYEHAGAGYGGGFGWNFKPIKGYGAISIEGGVSLKQDSRGNPITDREGNGIIDEEWLDLNGKPAINRYRFPKTFKAFTKADEQKWYNGTLKDAKGNEIDPYQCYYHKKNPKYEFCHR